jgi:hypothetical protein
MSGWMGMRGAVGDGFVMPMNRCVARIKDGEMKSMRGFFTLIILIIKGSL